jgi:hypothetical protein
VISPLGQRVVAETWEWLLADMAEEKAWKPILREASAALESFKKGRLGEVTTQMQVCWLRDHFHKLTQEEIATLVDTPRPLVSRYTKLQERQREYAKRYHCLG